MKRRVLFLASLLFVVGALAGGARATANYARVTYGGSLCNGGCNFVVQYNGGSPVAVGTGANHVLCHDYISPVDYVVHLGNPCWNENSQRNDGCTAVMVYDAPCSVRAWARKACASGGYRFSPTRGGREIYSGYGELLWTYWGLFNIDPASPCYPENPKL